MKLTLTFLITFILLGVGSVLAQVGINTVDPQADLDINGDLRVREVLTDNTATSVLVLGADNVVKKNTTLLGSGRKSSVQGRGVTSFKLLNLVLLEGWNKIPFTIETYDDNNDFNTDNSEFLVPRDGIYYIYVYFESISAISASEVGVGIFKKTSEGVYSLLMEDTYLNVSANLLGISVSTAPPARKAQRIVKLNAGDVILFAAKVPLLDLNLISGNKSFFSIEQIR